MKPKIISSKQIYKGKIVDLSLAEIQDRGKRYEREIITHPGSAVVVPIFDDNYVGLVCQYRHAARRFLLELPAGTIDAGETPQDCAFREVEEEIGFKCGKLEKLTEFFVSPGFLDEKMHLFMATSLKESKQNLDVDEILTVERKTFSESISAIESGEIEDAKTIIGLIFAAKRFGIDFNP